MKTPPVPREQNRCICLSKPWNIFRDFNWEGTLLLVTPEVYFLPEHSVSDMLWTILVAYRGARSSKVCRTCFQILVCVAWSLREYADAFPCRTLDYSVFTFMKGTTLAILYSTEVLENQLDCWTRSLIAFSTFRSDLTSVWASHLRIWRSNPTNRHYVDPKALWSRCRYRWVEIIESVQILQES